MDYLLSTDEIFMVENSGIIIKVETKWHYEPPDMLRLEGYITYVVLLPKMSNLNFIVKKQTLKFRLWDIPH